MNLEQMEETIKNLNEKIDDLQLDLEIAQRTNAMMRARMKELDSVVNKQCLRVTPLRFPELVVTARDLTRGPFIIDNAYAVSPTATPPRR